MRMRQISYLGNFLFLEITRASWSVSLVDGSANTNALSGLLVAAVELVSEDGAATALSVGKVVTMKAGASASVRRKGSR